MKNSVSEMFFILVPMGFYYSVFPEFSLDVVKCCGSCYKRLARRCDMATVAEEALNDEELLLARMENWTEEEISQLRESKPFSLNEKCRISSTMLFRCSCAQ